MPLPTLNDVRPVNPALTGLSIGFRNPMFIGEMIAPFVDSPQKTGTFFTYSRADQLRLATGAERAPDAPYTKVGYGVSSDTFSAIERGFEKVLGDPTRAASQTPEDLLTEDTRFLTHMIQLELEKAIAAAAFVTGVWGTSTTLAGGDKWSDYENSDPIGDAKTVMRTIRRNTATEPNVCFVGALGWEDLQDHPLVLEKYKYTQVSVMTEDLVARALGIDRLVVGKAVENTAAAGAAYVGGDVWTDNALFLVVNSPALQVANGAYTFIWNETGQNFPWAIQQYRDESIRAEITRVFTHYAVKIVSSAHGYLFLDTN